MFDFFGMIIIFII